MINEQELVINDDSRRNLVGKHQPDKIGVRGDLSHLMHQTHSNRGGNPEFFQHGDTIHRIDSVGLDPPNINGSRGGGGGGPIENTENSVNQGNAEVVMKGQYSDVIVGDNLEDHSQQLFPRQNEGQPPGTGRVQQPPIPAQQTQAKKQGGNRLKVFRPPKMRSKGAQVGTDQTIKGRMFQINIKEDVNALQPAMILRHSVSPPAGERGGKITSQGHKRRMTTTYFNETLNLNNAQQHENRFSNMDMRKSLREQQAMSGLKNPSSPQQPSSPKVGSPTSTSNYTKQNGGEQKPYKRTLMTQRFSNRRIANNIAMNTAPKQAETPRNFMLPRLNLKGQEKRASQTNKFVLSEDFSSKTGAGIIIQEMRLQGDDSVGLFHLGGAAGQRSSRPTTNHANTKNSDLVTFDPSSGRHRVSASSSQFYKLRGNMPQTATNSDRPLIEFEDYEVMSDDQCIQKNVYNIVETTHPHHSRKSTAPQAKAVFKVVSPRTSKGRKVKRTEIECGGVGNHDTTDNSIREAIHKNELKKATSVRGFQADVPFFSDGIIKEVVHDDQNDGFRDFISLPQYFVRYEKMLKRYQNRKSENSFYRKISIEDFLICKQIYPRIFSIKNTLKGTIDDPDVEFNPAALNQYEIFLVKSVSYLYHHQFEKAQYFLEQGSIQWPSASIEFDFNQGLLAYLREDFEKSAKIYEAILSQLQTEDLVGQALNLVFSVSLNLILSLAKDQGKFRQILLLAKKYPTFKEIKMMKVPLNMKIQQLLYFALQKYKLQRTLSRKLKEVQEPSFRHSNKETGIETSRFGHQPLNNEMERSPIPSISSSITHSETEDLHYDLETSSFSSDGEEGDTDHTHTHRQSLSPRASKKEISYHQFKKRGNNNIPLRNMKQLEVIKTRKAAEREAKATATSYKNLNQVFLNAGPQVPGDDKPVKKPPSPKKKYQVKKGNKACFYNIENIQDTRSPDYLMSMTDIINSLSCKDDIQQNKALMYQLQKLDETVKQSMPYKQGPPEAESNDTEETTHPTPEQIVTATTVPFPFQINEIQKKDMQKFGGGILSSGEESASPERDTQINLCMRNLEELRLEVAMSHGTELQRCDPVMNQYRIICNSIYTLLKEEKLVDLLKDTKKMLKSKGIRREMFKKISIAKEILLSSLIRHKPGQMDLETQTNDQLVEIELLQEKVKDLKDIMMQEAIQREESGTMEYMVRLEKDIKKMLLIARKKSKERDRQQKQEEEDKQISKNAKEEGEQVPENANMVETTSLSSLLKRPKFQEVVSEKFKVDKKKYLESIQKEEEEVRPVERGLRRSESQSLTQQVLKKFKAVDPDQFRLMMDRTKAFLKWVFDTFGGYFIAQRSYCMTEFFELAPHHIRLYFDHVSQILSTQPMRIPSLAEAFTDNEWTELQQQELIYNRDDMMFKILSQGMRQPKCLDNLGDGKHEWQVEVTQKFNMMSILNFLMREGIKVFSQPNPQEESVESDLIHNSDDKSRIKSELQHEALDPLVDQDGLNLIKDQFARLKYKGPFNTLLIDKLIGIQVPMFRQFNFQTRENFYRRSHHRTLSYPQEGESFLDIEKLNKETIIVILSGNIFIQIQIEEPQEMIMVEKVDKQKRRYQVMVPAGPPIKRWVTKQVLGPGMAIPVQFLHWMRQRQSEYRLFIDKDLGTTQNTLNPQPVTIDYLEFENKELGDLIYQPIYQSLIKKVELIQNVDLFNGDSHLGASKLDKLSPYVMFVMAALFKVQVFKMSEVITHQDDVPNCMFVILDGQAKAVYEDKIERKGEVCPFSRRSIRTDLPQEMRFGMMNHSQSRSPTKGSASNRSPIVSPKNESGTGSSYDLNIFNHSPSKKGDGSKKMRTPRNITFQNLVFNQEWSEHQPTKKISFNHHIEFGFLTEGQYFGSRVVLDEGALRNYIKTSKDRIKDLLRPAQLAHRQTLNDRLKTGFIKANVIKPEKKPKSDSDSEQSQQNISELSFMDELAQQFDVDDNSKPQKDGSRIGSAAPVDYEEREIQVMKNFLLKSQLSIVVGSRSLQAMVMYKQDKAYFHESVKKFLTEIIQEKNFIDMDRPIERNRQIDFIRSTQKQWEQYKVKNEVDALRETFHQKYEAFPR